MKKYVCLMILLMAGKAMFAQAIPTTGCEIVYFYDAAGNRTERAYYCNGGATMFTANNPHLLKDSLTEATATGVRVEALYPNPNNGRFTVIFDYELKKADVILRDLSGKVVQRFTINGSRIGVDISKQAAGTYFLSIVVNHTIMLTQKVIKAQ